jgi:uroporphyrinogen decarboxylase
MTVLQGKKADRPPINAYWHVPGRERKAEDLFQSTMENYEKYDWDFIKIHPAATIAKEIWGNVYDYSIYENVIYPKLVSKAFKSADDLSLFTKKAGDFGAFGDMIKAVELIKASLKEDDVPIFMTMFTPVHYICDALGVPTVRRHQPASREDNVLFTLFKEKPELMRNALQAITDTFVDYAERIMDAGADGFFYAEIGWARAGYIHKSEWESWIKPYDIQILECIRRKGGKIIFHTCGMKSNPEWFLDYPIDVLHWDQGAEGNPPLEGSAAWLNGIVPMGGVNEMIFGTGQSERIAEETKNTLEKNKDLAYILAPYCSINPNSTEEDIFAFRNAMREVYPEA